MVAISEITAGFDCIVCDAQDHIATITLNRPERRNALSYRAYDELEASFRAAAADADVRCIIEAAAGIRFIALSESSCCRLNFTGCGSPHVRAGWQSDA